MTDRNGSGLSDLAILGKSAHTLDRTLVRIRCSAEALAEMRLHIEESLIRIDRSRRMLDEILIAHAAPFAWWSPDSGNFAATAAVQGCHGGEPCPRSARVGQTL